MNPGFIINDLAVSALVNALKSKLNAAKPETGKIKSSAMGGYTDLPSLRKLAMTCESSKKVIEQLCVVLAKDSDNFTKIVETYKNADQQIQNQEKQLV